MIKNSIKVLSERLAEINGYLNLNFFFILLFNIFFIGLLSYFMPIMYEENDDPVMLAIASGIYSGIPDAHLVFINYLYGWIVSGLYKLYSGIEWYTVLFLIIHLIAFSIIIWEIINKEISIVYKILYMSSFYLLEAWIIFKFQFTTTAAICALSGIILFISDNNKQKLLGILLFLIATLIRFEAAFLVLIICLPLFFYRLKTNYKSKSYLIQITLFIALPILAKAIDYKIYNSDDEWKNYKEYNYLRGKINDNPNAWSLKNLPPNITESDYTLFLFFFPDPKTFDNETVKSIFLRLGSQSKFEQIKNIPQNLNPYKTYLLLVCLIAFAQLLICSHKNRIIVLASLFLFLLLSCYISLSATLKERVFYSMLIPFFWVLLTTNNTYLKFKFKNIFTPLLLIVFIVIYTPDFYMTRRWTRARTNHIAPQQDELLDKENMCVIPFYGFMPHYISPFKISERFKETSVRYLGWLTHIPFNKNELDSYSCLIDKNMIYLENFTKNAIWPNIKNSIATHYGTNVEYIVKHQTENYSLIQIVSTSNNKIEIKN